MNTLNAAPLGGAIGEKGVNWEGQITPFPHIDPPAVIGDIEKSCDEYSFPCRLCIDSNHTANDSYDRVLNFFFGKRNPPKVRTAIIPHSR